jgi:hypothetical protein
MNSLTEIFDHRFGHQFLTARSLLHRELEVLHALGEQRLQPRLYLRRRPA